MMKLIIVNLFICTFLFGQNNAGNEYIIGFSNNIFQDLDRDDIKAAANILGSRLVKLEDETGTSKTIVLDPKTEFSQYVEKGVDLFILLTNEYLEEDCKKYVTPKYSIVVDGEVGIEYKLLVHQKSNINLIEDLKDKSIAVLASDYESPVIFWTKSILGLTKSGDLNSYFKTFSIKLKAAPLIHSVFFENLDACITTTNSFSVASELNPQVKNNLKVIVVSPRLVSALVCINKMIEGTRKEEIIIHSLNNLDKNENGKQILNLFSVDKLVPYSEEHILNIKEILNKIKSD